MSIKAEIRGVIFDLDGVIVSTDEYHYQAWQKLADEEGIYFDRHINERLRGVSRMESLEILLERAKKHYGGAEKAAFAERKNACYRALLKNITPQDMLPGALELLNALRAGKIKIATGSSSKNTPGILAAIGLSSFFDAISDGNNIAKSKPDPEVFLKAAQMLGLDPKHCLVVEDAAAGVEAALAAGMRVLAVGFASSDPRATLRAKDLSAVTAAQVLNA